ATWVGEVAWQRSQAVVFPSSPAAGGQTTPSPQPVTSRQDEVDPSQSSVLPSSHSSPGSRMPSPQPWTKRHSKPHTPGVGGSHSSPQAVATIPSPQRRPDSVWHEDEQPSQSSVFPSSQASGPQRAPSPQPVTSRQSIVHE